MADTALILVGFTLTGGQAGDNLQPADLVDEWRSTHPWQKLHMAADKAYSYPSTRIVLRRRRIGHTSPEEKDQTTRHQSKGSRGGQLPKFDPDRYRVRNIVERVCARPKQWRGTATRTDKHARTIAAGVTPTVIIMHSHTN